MMKLNPSLLLVAAIALCAGSGFAQGIIQFDWVGVYGASGVPKGDPIFQASFQVPECGMAPGSNFNDYPVFAETFTVTSPDRYWTPGSIGTIIEGVSFSNGFLPDGSLLISGIGNDPQLPPTPWANTILFLRTTRITESVQDGAGYGEDGYWTFRSVPEPPVAGLLGFCVLVLFRRRRTGNRC
jgi:hypothetical protein